MRLLRLKRSGELALAEFVGDGIPPYAILSHTWGDITEEVLFKDVVDGTGRHKTGYSKVLFCANRAAADGYEYFWIDTCSIDKSSSAELSEAINSMFRWYRDAAKCYVYLADVSKTDDTSLLEMLEHSRWFTRGWTLQELLAPKSVEFFSAEGNYLGNKESLQDLIHVVTKIPFGALQGQPLTGFRVQDRLSWAESRQTTREEDAAYSLLGLFDVHMPLIYGEGRKKALARLRKEIAESIDEVPTDDENIKSVNVNKDITSQPNEPKRQASLFPVSIFHSSPISAVYSSPTRIDVWVLGSNRKLHHLRIDADSWLPNYWQAESGLYSNAPIAFSRGDPQFEVLAPGTDGQVYYMAKNNNWFARQSIEAIGGQMASPLSALSLGQNRLDVIGLGKDKQVYYKFREHDEWLPSAQGWESLGGDFTSRPEIISWGSDRLDVFVLGNDKLVRHKWYSNGTWSPADKWDVTTTVPVTTPLAAASWGPGHIELFALSTRNEMLFNRWWGEGWGTWTPLGGTFISRPCAVSRGGGLLDLFCVGDDHQLWHIHCKDRWWQKWESLGGDFVSAPTAVCLGSQRLDVFCKGRDQEIYHMNWRDKQWVSLGIVV